MGHPRTITVKSSHGELTIGYFTGVVISRKINTDEPHYLKGIKRFNLDEWKELYKKAVPDELDILDLGYWILVTTDYGEYVEDTIVYEPPAEDWRQLIKELVQNEKIH